MTGVDLAKKAHMKSLGEHNVKIDVESIEEKPFETLDAKKTGIVSVCVCLDETQYVLQLLFNLDTFLLVTYGC